MRPLHNHGAAIPVTLAVITSVGGVFAAGYGGLSYYHARTTSFAVSLIPTALELELLLRRSGVSPEVLAAAGLQAQGIAAIVTRGSDYVVPNFNAINEAQREHINARGSHGALVKLVRSGQADAAQIEQLDRARTRLDTALAAEQAWIDAVYSACVGGLSSQQQSVMAVLNSNRDWDAPLQYRAVARSQEDWAELRKALANVRISAKLGESPDPAAQQTVLAANANASVSAAKAGLNNLPLIRVQWETTINP